MDLTSACFLLVTVAGVLEGVIGLPEPRIGTAQQQLIGKGDLLPMTIQDWLEIQQHIQEIVDIKIEDRSTDNETTDYETTDFGSTGGCGSQKCEWVGGKQTGRCSPTPISGYINTGQAECGIGCRCYILHPRPWVDVSDTTQMPYTDIKTDLAFRSDSTETTFPPSQTDHISISNTTCGGPRIGGCGDGYCVYDGQPCRFTLSNCLCEAVGTFCCDSLPSQ